VPPKVSISGKQAEAIRALLGDYVDCVDRGRLGALAQLYLPDGILDVRGPGPDRGVHQGREAILARMRATAESLAAHRSVPRIRHHVSSIRISGDGPHAAKVDSYFLAVTDGGPDHWGRYGDRLVHDADRWRFSLRRVTVEGIAPGGWIAGALGP
jgi:ketosteroid isomerase-like protein